MCNEEITFKETEYDNYFNKPISIFKVILMILLISCIIALSSFNVFGYFEEDFDNMDDWTNSDGLFSSVSGKMQKNNLDRYATAYYDTQQEFLDTEDWEFITHIGSESVNMFYILDSTTVTHPNTAGEFVILKYMGDGLIKYWGGTDSAYCTLSPMVLPETLPAR